jgi:hypothetical protein
LVFLANNNDMQSFFGEVPAWKATPQRNVADRDNKPSGTCRTNGKPKPTQTSSWKI